MTVRVMLVDDHALIRDGLRAALGNEPDMEVVGAASSVAEALVMVPRLAPDVVLVDVNLGAGADGLELVDALRQRYDSLGIVVLTMYDDDELMLRALRTGASAYALKTSSTDALIVTMRHAVAAPRSFSAEGLTRVLARASEAPPAQVLTDREQEVLEHLASGHPIATIARQMYLGVSTLKTHIAHVYDKLDATSRTEAVMTAVRLGLLDVRAN